MISRLRRFQGSTPPLEWAVIFRWKRRSVVGRIGWLINRLEQARLIQWDAVSLRAGVTNVANRLKQIAGPTTPV